MATTKRRPTLPARSIVITANDQPAGIIWRGWQGRIERVLALWKRRRKGKE